MNARYRGNCTYLPADDRAVDLARPAATRRSTRTRSATNAETGGTGAGFEDSEKPRGTCAPTDGLDRHRTTVAASEAMLRPATRTGPTGTCHDVAAVRCEVEPLLGDGTASSRAAAHGGTHGDAKLASPCIGRFSGPANLAGPSELTVRPRRAPASQRVHFRRNACSTRVTFFAAAG
jgi:hypothetical protein